MYNKSVSLQCKYQKHIIMLQGKFQGKVPGNLGDTAVLAVWIIAWEVLHTTLSAAL